MGVLKTSFAVTGAMMLLTSGAHGGAAAGTFTPIGEGGGTYSFTGCERPAPFKVASFADKKGSDRVRARNTETRRYNAHVAVVNAYLVCIAEEAGRDLQIYFNAVNATMEAEQNRLLEELEAEGKVLDSRGSAGGKDEPTNAF